MEKTKDTAEKIVDEIISTIEPLKVVPANTKPEKFVNVGIEATKRLFIDNRSLIISRIEKFADQQTTSQSSVIKEQAERIEKLEAALRGIKTPAMKFEINDDQAAKYNKWRDKLKKKNYGTIGGGYWFMFCPTGLGDIVKVRRDDGKEIDLTEMNKW